MSIFVLLSLLFFYFTFFLNHRIVFILILKLYAKQRPLRGRIFSHAKGPFLRKQQKLKFRTKQLWALSFKIFFIWLNSPSPQCTSLLPMQLGSWKQPPNLFSFYHRLDVLVTGLCTHTQPKHAPSALTGEWESTENEKIPPVCLTHPHVHGHGLVVNKLYWKQLSYDHAPNSLIMAPGHVTAFLTSTSHNQYRPLNSGFQVLDVFFPPPISFFGVLYRLQ